MQSRQAERRTPAEGVARAVFVATLCAGCTTDFDRFQVTSQTENPSFAQAGEGSQPPGPGNVGPSAGENAGSSAIDMTAMPGDGGEPVTPPSSDLPDGGAHSPDASTTELTNACMNNNGGCGDPARWTCTSTAGVAACADVAECASDNGGCGDPTYWSCVEQMGQAPVCRDIDECATNNGGCGDAGDFACSNREGAAPSCAPIGACLSNNGGCGAPSLYRCFDDGSGQPSCEDIDECATDNGGCGDARYWTCTNNAGAAPTCRDIDECATDNGGCGDARYWTCTNNSGATPTCRDINECANDNGGCGDARYWTCTNNSGAAPTCRDIDECAANNGGCGNPLYWRCTDRDGTDPQCSDIDSCRILNGGCGADECVDNIGGPPTCIPRQVCGNGMLEGSEECDFAAPGATPFNCSRSCRRQSLYIPCDETASTHPECLDGTVCLYNMCTRSCEGISDCDYVSEVPDLQIQCPQPLGTTCVIRCSGNADCPPGSSCNGGGVCIGMP